MRRQSVVLLKAAFWALAPWALVGCPSGEGPDALHVQPLVINFGDEGVQENILVRNDGAVPLTYTAGENADWLSLSQVGGVLAAAETQQVQLTADRTGLATGNYTAQVTITSGAAVETVSVALSVAGSPLVDVSPLTLNLTNGQTSGAIAIENTGAGRLTWGAVFVDPTTGQEATSLNDGVFTLDPSGGALQPGGSTSVSVEIDRDALDSGVYNFIVRIKTNAGNVDVEVNVAQGVEAIVAIDTDPDDGELNAVTPAILEFGEDRTVATLFIWNAGPVSSTLEWILESEDEGQLVSFEPTGEQVSQGTNSVFDVDPDKVTEVTVVVNRDFMEGLSDSTAITVNAGDTAESVEILVNVSKAPLRFEGAMNRTRPPFVMRFVFLMRDASGKPIELDPTTLADPTSVFSLWEDERRIDLDETNFFVRGAAGLRRDVVVLLDYTGSMSAAQQVRRPDLTDALQDLYANTSGLAQQGVVDALVDDLTAIAPSPSVAVMEFHERQQRGRVIHPFTTDGASIKEELDEFDLPVAERGASALYDAIIYACEQLAVRGQGLLPFEEADVRALYVITDGDDTSSIAEVGDAVTVAQENRVRVYPIGYGEDVPTVDLIQLAEDTGGHYYAATGQTAEEKLRELMVAQEEWGSAQGQLAYELERQVVLNYNTLFQDGSHSYLIRAAIDEATGSFEKDAEFAIGGDVRAGQIALWTNGVDPDTGEAIVYIRSDYVPRNIFQVLFRLWVEPAEGGAVAPLALSDVEVVGPETASSDSIGGALLDPEYWFGGPLADDSLVTLDGTGVRPSVLVFLTSDQEHPLPYSGFGAILKVRVRGITSEATLHFRVDNEIYRNPPFTKFFQYPDSILLSEDSAIASEVPVLIEQGFDPDDPNAWNRDGDNYNDFDDIRPEDEDVPAES